MNFKESLIQLLKNPLPGETAQWRMAHLKREQVSETEYTRRNAKKSAVIILICKEEEEFFIPLTQRFEYNGAHSNQVSLPGGKFEESDEMLVNTAIRECNEEIGVEANIEILTALTPVYIPVSNFLVQPFVGMYEVTNPIFIPQATEVKKILKLKINELLNDTIEKEAMVEPAPGYKFKTPYFEVEGQIVWGATAMILSEFKAVLKSV
jgi:8-oxo-dGTP pyrophosphatase MutT (NUDIX family)